MYNRPICPVVALMPEFAQVVESRFALDEARCRANGAELRRIKREENRVLERLEAMETLIMVSTAESEVGRTLQLVLASADLDTLHAWTLDNGEEVDVAARSKKRLAGMLESLLQARDLEQIPAVIRSCYLGSGFFDDWIPDTSGGSPVPGANLPRREVIGAS